MPGVGMIHEKEIIIAIFAVRDLMEWVFVQEDTFNIRALVNWRFI